MAIHQRGKSKDVLYYPVAYLTPLPKVVPLVFGLRFSARKPRSDNAKNASQIVALMAFDMLKQPAFRIRLELIILRLFCDSDDVASVNTDQYLVKLFLNNLFTFLAEK